MRVSVVQKNDRLIFKFKPDPDDRLSPTNKYRMASRRCEFRLPGGFSLEHLHRDHLALVTLMLCMPFVGSRLTLPFPVSDQFKQATRVISRFKVGPCDPDLEPYYPTSDSRPALAFSGGVDSTAALLLMPENTVCVFLDRPLLRGSLYDKDAPLSICEELKSRGREIHMIESDMEYLRDPVGFPVDVANSAPAILLAELLSFDSIAFGTILESAYGIGHQKYRHYPEGNHYRTWGTLFKAAGIPLNQVVSGLSEVLTSRLACEDEEGGLSQSCIRGKWREPCMNCWKCFRKVLLDKTIKGEDLDDELLDKLFRIKEARHHLKGFPIKHEDTLTWLTHRYTGNHELMNLLKKRVRGDLLALDWLESWNDDSLEVVHKNHRSRLQEKMASRFTIMTDEMKDTMRAWDMTSMLEDPHYQSLRDELIERLSD